MEISPYVLKMSAFKAFTSILFKVWKNMAVVQSWFVFITFFILLVYGKRFKPTWESLDQHVAPEWYDEAKIGIFMHWGVYSVPSFGVPSAGSEWLWQRWMQNESHAVKFMRNNYPPDFRYPDFAPQWRAEFFNASEWADLIKESGARYYVITSKHHEGFTLWKSNVSWNWNAVDIGPHRDLIGELAHAIRTRTNVHFGMYYSLFEWFHPLYLFDKSNNFTTQEYVKNVALPQMHDYVTRYKPEYIWSDGDAGPTDYWMAKEFLAWLYSDSPVRDNILVNDRWGPEATCKHGDVKNCADRFTPHSKVNFKWEDAMTLDKESWGYRRKATATEVYDIESLLALLARTVSAGGNLLMNVGPTPDGRIIPIFQERLKQLGSWMRINGDAIYSTKPWRVHNDTAAKKIMYTSNRGTVFAILLQWPPNGIITLHEVVPTSSTAIFLHGYPSKLDWFGKSGKPGIQIDVNHIKQRPCLWAWSLRMYFVQ
ncbi:alpha-L-fucosidase-like isoform X2 [Hydractinia symbiolongicarpus]|uniref:alpha-L-fucosidase-like isoform X2 n=1 Tax=Hydractinia symbiolongicarpus TaxID=13093 RepID=UPI00254A486D|nr:alpha-L-fucosidase-like isoform X2 [Hydractinia symbiolongicarpus]